MTRANTDDGRTGGASARPAAATRVPGARPARPARPPGQKVMSKAPLEIVRMPVTPLLGAGCITN